MFLCFSCSDVFFLALLSPFVSTLGLNPSVREWFHTGLIRCVDFVDSLVFCQAPLLPKLLAANMTRKYMFRSNISLLETLSEIQKYTDLLTSVASERKYMQSASDTLQDIKTSEVWLTQASKKYECSESSNPHLVAFSCIFVQRLPPSPPLKEA